MRGHTGKDGMRQGTCSFYGPTELFGVISVNYFFATAVLQELTTGKQITHSWGYNTKETFTAGLVYPEGGHFSFRLTKGTDNYDASAHFIDCH